jgi:lysophospholipase L1-like esterase
MAIVRVSAKHVEARREHEELADVVVAAESRDSRGERWYVRLRAWLFCLLFLGMAEGGARFTFDANLSLHHERFDNFPNPAALDAYVSQIKRDKAFRVVVLGDSVVVGPSLLAKDETIPENLERALNRMNPGREIHVWNLGIAGARSTDLYCILLKVLEASPDLVVIANNYLMYTLDIRLKPVAYPWTARSLPEIPDAIKPLLPEDDYKTKIDFAATQLVESNIRLIGMRQAINGMLFGVQPRMPYENPNPAIMVTTRIGKAAGVLPIRPWREKFKTTHEFKKLYANAVEPDNLNGKFYHLMMEELGRRKTPAFFYMTPQNPAIMAACLPWEFYRRNISVANSFTEGGGYLSKDYSELLPDNMFVDNDHLMPEGNRLLGEAIAKDISPMVAQILSSGPTAVARTANRTARQ